eukprot:503880_1
MDHIHEHIDDMEQFSPRNINYKEVDKKDELSKWIRNKWKVGSFCEIYSNFFKTWSEGTIKRIFNDLGYEWLEIEYMADNTMRVKHVARDDVEAVRPLSTAMHIYKYVFGALTQVKGSKTSKKNAITEMEMRMKQFVNVAADNMNKIQNILNEEIVISDSKKKELAAQIVRIAQIANEVLQIL